MNNYYWKSFEVRLYLYHLASVNISAEISQSIPYQESRFPCQTLEFWFRSSTLIFWKNVSCVNVIQDDTYLVLFPLVTYSEKKNWKCRCNYYRKEIRWLTTLNYSLKVKNLIPCLGRWDHCTKFPLTMLYHWSGRETHTLAVRDQTGSDRPTINSPTFHGMVVAVGTDERVQWFQTWHSTKVSLTGIGLYCGTCLILMGRIPL